MSQCVLFSNELDVLLTGYHELHSFAEVDVSSYLQLVFGEYAQRLVTLSTMFLHVSTCIRAQVWNDGVSWSAEEQHAAAVCSVLQLGAVYHL